MPVTSTTIYTCDRDGTVSEPTEGGLPEGWSTVHYNTVAAPSPDGSPPSMTTGTAILCPACSALVLDAVKAVPDG